jgi:hypothetical protein
MKSFLLLLFLSLILVACAGDEPTVVPTLAAPAVPETDLDSPRASETPSSNLPPTWTPEPAGAAGHSVTAVPTPIITRVIHVVQVGETLGEIAERYGISLADLITTNAITNPDIIEVGTQLIIPGN